MKQTNLRYECADTFGIVNSGDCVALLDDQTLLTAAGSLCLGFSLKSRSSVLKIAHCEKLSGGMGTGRALNSDLITCLDTVPRNSGYQVATGWADGSVRIFEVDKTEMTSNTLTNSLIHGDTSQTDVLFGVDEPLTLNGHSSCSVKAIAYDRDNASRLASAGSDGAVVLWDVLSEAGQFRLLGHKGPVTSLIFVKVAKLDGLITAGLDGLLKVWDLEGRACMQVVTTNGTKMMGCCTIGTELDRLRVVVPGGSGQVHVWSLNCPESLAKTDADTSQSGVYNACKYMGRLSLPPEIASSSENVQFVRSDKSGSFLAVLHSNSKQVYIFRLRERKESARKRLRRLKRANEKAKKQTTKQYGLLDDHDDDEAGEVSTSNTIRTDTIEEEFHASDEFEYIGFVRASRKVSTVVFIGQLSKGEIVRLGCVFPSNDVEVISLKERQGYARTLPTTTAHPPLETLQQPRSHL